MDVREAAAFLAVADELNFGRAAEKLHMASPPLSRLIRKIEKDLGAQLFERNTRSVTLTHQGEALIEPARELVMLSRRLRDIVQRAAVGTAGRVRLGFGEAIVSMLAGEVAREVGRRHPGIKLDLVSSQFSSQGQEKLVDGSLDLLIGRMDVVPPELDSVVVGQEKLLVAMPEAHRLADHDPVDIQELAREPWVVLPGGGASMPSRLNLLAVKGGFVPQVVDIAPDSPTLLLLVSAGVGIAPTLSSVCESVPTPGVVFRELTPDQGPVEVRLVWRRGDRNAALHTVIGVATELAEQA